MLTGLQATLRTHFFFPKYRKLGLFYEYMLILQLDGIAGVSMDLQRVTRPGGISICSQSVAAAFSHEEPDSQMHINVCTNRQNNEKC